MLDGEDDKAAGVAAKKRLVLNVLCGKEGRRGRQAVSVQRGLTEGARDASVVETHSERKERERQTHEGRGETVFGGEKWRQKKAPRTAVLLFPQKAIGGQCFFLPRFTVKLCGVSVDRRRRGRREEGMTGGRRDEKKRNGSRYKKENDLWA
jgi:hypothetical protein